MALCSCKQSASDADHLEGRRLSVMSALHHALVGRSPEKEARIQTEARSAECKIYSGFPHNIRQRGVTVHSQHHTHGNDRSILFETIYIKKNPSLLIKI